MMPPRLRRGCHAGPSARGYLFCAHPEWPQLQPISFAAPAVSQYVLQ
jgi:hypothetical protein